VLITCLFGEIFTNYDIKQNFRFLNYFQRYFESVCVNQEQRCSTFKKDSPHL